MTELTIDTSPPASLAAPLRRETPRRGDGIFRGITLAAGASVLAILVAIAVFLVLRALPALHENTASFLTTRRWQPDAARPAFGIAALAFGTVVSSVLALGIAVPVSLGVAVFITEYAPRRLASVMGYAVDMLAAVPSVVFGLWGLHFLLPKLVPVQSFLAAWFGWIPLFADPNGATAVVSKSLFAASVILAIMILPIIAAIGREVLAQVPDAQREAALALGATRWEMVRMSVLPPSRPGLVSAVMLGLGRALGETIAVALVIGATFNIDWRVLLPGGNTIAANIANTFGEAGAVGRGALIASGLVLFAITLVVNFAARAVIARRGIVQQGLA